MAAIPIAGVLAVGLTACGDPGSSGTTAPEDVTGEGCEPIAGDTLVALKDDKNLQASENLVPAFNADSADDAAVDAVNSVSAVLTTQDLTDLNKKVDIDRMTPMDAAEDYAKSNDLATGISDGSGSVVVGHANFSESQIVASIYKSALDAAGFEAELKDVGNREAYLPALEDGDFDVIPEYAASLTETLNPDASADDAQDPVASPEIGETMETLSGFASDAGLAMGEPAEASTQNAYVVTQAFADEHGVETLSEFADKCSGKASVLAGPPECPERVYCQLGLQETYEIQFGDFKSLDIGTSSKRSVVSGESTVGTVTTTDSALAEGVKVDPEPSDED